jgi:hypothetical protein
LEMVRVYGSFIGAGGEKPQQDGLH